MMNNQQIQYGGQSFGYGQQQQIIQNQQQQQQQRPAIPCWLIKTFYLIFKNLSYLI